MTSCKQSVRRGLIFSSPHLGVGKVALVKNRNPERHTPLKPSRDKDDLRQAASMAVTVPGSVTTAALAVLGITGAIATYIASHYQHLTLFYVFASASAILMIWGAWQGTHGITELTNKGYQGEWSVETKDRRFDKQSGATLLGLLTLGLAVVFGFTAQPRPSESLTVRVTDLRNLSIQEQLARNKARISHVENTFRHVSQELRRLQHWVDRMWNHQIHHPRWHTRLCSTIRRMSSRCDDDGGQLRR